MSYFPYHKTTSGDYFPIIEFIVYNEKKVARTAALIDSGATISVFGEEVADQLDINIEQGKEIYLGGVGGRIKGYIHNLWVKVAGKKFLCPIVFSREYLVSFNLLGRDGFFVNFKIIFDEKRKMIELQ